MHTLLIHSVASSAKAPNTAAVQLAKYCTENEMPDSHSANDKFCPSLFLPMKYRPIEDEYLLKRIKLNTTVGEPMTGVLFQQFYRKCPATQSTGLLVYKINSPEKSTGDRDSIPSLLRKAGGRGTLKYKKKHFLCCSFAFPHSGMFQLKRGEESQ